MANLRIIKAFAGLRLPPRVRETLVVLVLLAGFSIFAYLLNEHLPFKDWLFFRYATYWLCALVLCASSLGFGLPFLSMTWGKNSPLVERLVIGFPIGLFFFASLWTLLGFFHLLGDVSAFLLPLLAIGIGAKELKRAAVQGLKMRAHTLKRGPSWNAIEVTLCALGLLGLLLVYAPLMTPQNVSFDARWYHLPLAERYAVEGGIVPYKEGWFIAGAPQLASLIFSWCFSLPFSTTFDQVEACQHVEFLIFVYTIASVPLLVRKVVPRNMRVPRNTWAFVFFFPGLFVFDSGVSGGADHIAALWAIPLFLVCLHAYKNLSFKNLLPLCILVAATISTKFTALGLLVGPGLALGFRFVQLMVRGPNSRARVSLLLKLLFVFSLLLIGTSPYWLKNWLWYGNPVFPLMAEAFPTRPWTGEASARLTAMSDDSAWMASRDWDGILTTLSQIYKFSFVPNNWSTFHRDLPVFGSLFTLLTPVLLLLRTKRLVLLALTATSSVLFWYWTFHQDRYLQAYVPWMAATVAGICLLVWQRGWVARSVLTLLVTLQLIWCGDAPFFGTHTLAGQPLQTTIQLLSSGFHGKRDERFVAYPEFEQVREVVDKKSLILRHEMQLHLGLARPSVTDWFQSGISWSKAGGPRGVHQKLEELGVTHLMWQAGRSRAVDSVGGDLVFFDYAINHTENLQKVGGLSVAEISKEAPRDAELLTLFLGCNTDYKNGLYQASQLNKIPFHGGYRRRTRFPAPIKGADQENAKELLQEARALAWDEKCFPLKLTPNRLGYARVAKRAALSLWIAPAR